MRDCFVEVWNDRFKKYTYYIQIYNWYNNGRALKEKKAEPHLSMDCFLPLCLFVCLFYEPGTMLGVYSYDSAQRSAQRFTCSIHTSEPVGGRLRPSNHPAKLFDRCWKNKGEKKTTLCRSPLPRGAPRLVQMRDQLMCQLNMLIIDPLLLKFLILFHFKMQC